MLAMIPSDFDVSLVVQDGHSSLFVAQRRDVWHFVVTTASNVDPNHQSVDITQFHWPRYVVARALVSLGKQDIGASHAQLLGINIDPNETLSITLNSINYPLPATLVKSLRGDIPIFERAANRVIVSGNMFVVPDAKTSRGHAVVTEQRSLAEAIAFEKESRKKLNPKNFGIYSAFCTWFDFIRDDPSKREKIAAGMAGEMINWNPDSIGDETYWESVFDIQEKLFEHRVWGQNLDADIDDMREAFLCAFEKLSSIQFAQFVLMNGMHAGGPFHPLATLFGIMNFDEYKTWRTRDLQPDSLEEQETRTQSSFIEMLGLQD